MQSSGSQQIGGRPADTEFMDDIFNNIVGPMPDMGRFFEEYREERTVEKQ